MNGYAGVEVRLGNGGAAFAGGATPDQPGDFTGVGACDLDGEGRLDVIMGTHVALNLGGGRFGAPVAYLGCGIKSELTGGDFDGNGKRDIACYLGNKIAIILSK